MLVDLTSLLAAEEIFHFSYASCTRNGQTCLILESPAP